MAMSLNLKICMPRKYPLLFKLFEFACIDIDDESEINVDSHFDVDSQFDSLGVVDEFKFLPLFNI